MGSPQVGAGQESLRSTGKVLRKDKLEFAGKGFSCCSQGKFLLPGKLQSCFKKTQYTTLSLPRLLGVISRIYNQPATNFNYIHKTPSQQHFNISTFQHFNSAGTIWLSEDKSLFKLTHQKDHPSSPPVSLGPLYTHGLTLHSPNKLSNLRGTTMTSSSPRTSESTPAHSPEVVKFLGWHSHFSFDTV